MDIPQEKNTVDFSKARVFKNMTVLGTSIVFLMSAYQGSAMLQSTMNHQGKYQGIGMYALSIQYISMCLTALLLPKFIIRKYGSKTVLTLSILPHIPFLAWNLYPNTIYLMIACASVMGVGSSLLWAAHYTYINDLSVLLCRPKVASVTSISSSNDHTDFKPKQIQSASALLFGFSGIAYLSTNIWGNMVSYFILSTGVSDQVMKNMSCVCGADFCNKESLCYEQNFTVANDSTKTTLIIIFVCMCLFSAFILAAFLDTIPKPPEKVQFSLNLLMATVKFFVKKEVLLLIPFTISFGMFEGFYVGDITKAYIGCEWGAYHVGLVTLFYGITCCIVSPLSGWTVRRFGRIPVFSLAACLDIGTCILLLYWTPDKNQPLVFFLVAGLWGVVMGLIWSQYRAFFGATFRDNQEAAFATFQLCNSSGACTAFILSNILCTNSKIYMLLGFCVFGYIGYIVVEYIILKDVEKETTIYRVNTNEAVCSSKL